MRNKSVSITLITILIYIILFCQLLSFAKTNLNTGNSMQEKKRWLTASQIIKPNGNLKGRSVILVHGFVGSPLDFKPLAKPLSEEGFRVVIPVVPEQTDKTPILKRGAYTTQKYIHWLTKIVAEETLINSKKPYIVGFSMGGALATIVADYGLVDKVVLISPYYSLPTANGLIWNIAKATKWFVPCIPKFINGKINDDEGYKDYTPGSYCISVKAFCRLQELASIARNSVSGISSPVLIIGSPNDEVASFELTKKLFKNKLNTEIIEFPKSNHILLYDYDQKEIIQKILSFLNTK